MFDLVAKNCGQKKSPKIKPSEIFKPREYLQYRLLSSSKVAPKLLVSIMERTL